MFTELHNQAMSDCVDETQGFVFFLQHIKLKRQINTE